MWKKVMQRKPRDKIKEKALPEAGGKDRQV